MNDSKEMFLLLRVNSRKSGYVEEPNELLAISSIERIYDSGTGATTIILKGGRGTITCLDSFEDTARGLGERSMLVRPWGRLAADVKKAQEALSEESNHDETKNNN